MASIEGDDRSVLWPTKVHNTYRRSQATCACSGRMLSKNSKMWLCSQSTIRQSYTSTGEDSTRGTFDRSEACDVIVSQATHIHFVETMKTDQTLKPTNVEVEQPLLRWSKAELASFVACGNSASMIKSRTYPLSRIYSFTHAPNCECWTFKRKMRSGHWTTASHSVGEVEFDP